MLSRREAARLIRAARLDPGARLYMPLFILIALYTGRREEAILSLRWSQIDLASNTINFEIAGRARTKKRRGQIQIPERLRPHLARARRRGSDLGPVLHINGRPIKNVKKGFAGACRRAGIEGASPLYPKAYGHQFGMYGRQSDLVGTIQILLHLHEDHDGDLRSPTRSNR